MQSNKKERLSRAEQTAQKKTAGFRRLRSVGGQFSVFGFVGWFGNKDSAICIRVPFPLKPILIQHSCAWLSDYFITRKAAALSTEIQSLFNNTIAGKTITFCVFFCTSLAITFNIHRTSTAIESTFTKQSHIHCLYLVNSLFVSPSRQYASALHRRRQELYKARRYRPGRKKVL